MSLEHHPTRQAGDATKAGDDGHDGHDGHDVDSETLLPPKLAAKLLGVGVRCLENWRGRGGGPEFVRISKRCVRYRRGTLIDYAAARTFASTADEAA